MSAGSIVSRIEHVRANCVRGGDDINDLLSINFWKGARSVGLRHGR
jgi:hypothetical protein